MSRGRGGKRTWNDNGWGEKGGYMNAKKQKLAEQFTADTPRNIEIAGSLSGSQMFKGVSIHVNGYTVPSSDELKRLMMLHGGTYYHYYSKTKVSHVIATRLPYAKIKELRDEKIVKPEWILDSIKEGKLLSDTPYQLYTNRTTSQGTLKFTGLKNVVPQQHLGHTTPTSTESDARSTSHGVCGVQGSKSLVGHSTAEFLDESFTSIASPESHNPTSSATLVASPKNSSTVQPSSSLPSKAISVRDRSELVGGNKGSARAGDANFVSEFYSNSRLHHISTWGAEFKAFVNKLQSSGDTSFPGREKLRQFVEDGDSSAPGSAESQEVDCNKNTATAENEDNLTSDTPEFHKTQSTKPNPKQLEKPNRVIMHVDMDCFFVSVGLRKRPNLVGKPVAVTHSKGKGMPEVNQETREQEKAYYANKYKQDGGKGLKSRHIELAKASLKETAEFQRLDETKEDSLGPKEADLLSVSIDSGEASAMLDETQSDLSKPIGQFCPTEPVDQAEPQRTRTHLEPFNSMAEIASCSYEARRSGVRNGMFMGEAKKRCADLQTIPYDFEGYRSVSQTLYETVASYTHDIEAVSCDEMFVDVTGILEDTGATPLDLAWVLRQEIKQKTHCNASAGLACNILLARMSTRKAKPNGQFFLGAGKAVEFMKQQPVKDLPGVGWSTGARLRTMGIGTCGDLQNLSLSSLQKEFGPKTGQSLYSYCRGIDDRPIRVERERKSVSAEINYGIRFNQVDPILRGFIKHLLTLITQNGEAENFVSELAAEVHQRLTALQMVGKTIVLKLKVRKAGAPQQASKFMGHGICDNQAKSTTLGQATDKLAVIQRESKALLAQMRIEVSDLRGVGIQISRLSAASSSASSATSSNKSLLDFVKPLPKTTSKTPSSVVPSLLKVPTRDQEAKERKNTGTILNFVSKQKSGTPAQGNPAPLRGLPQPKKTPLPPLPTFNPTTPTPSSRPSLMTEDQQEQFCLPSPSQLDPSVLAALPADIRLTIERSYEARKEQEESKLQVSNTASFISNRTADNLTKSDSSNSPKSSAHPLASSTGTSRLSIMNGGDRNLQSRNNHSSACGAASPEASCRTEDASRNPHSGRGPTSTHLSKNTKDTGMLIRDQPSTSNGTARIGRDSDQPSTSSGTGHSRLRYDPSVLKELPPDIVQEIMEQEGIAGYRSEREGQPEMVEEDKDVLGPVDVPGPVEALPSFSQIDLSCLEALPSELQVELQLAYQRQQKTSHDASPSKSSSAPKPSSPFKLHRRRGRPRKSSPRKGTKLGFRIPGAVGILEMVTGVKSSPSRKAVSVSTESNANKDAVDEDLGFHDNNDAEDTKATRECVNLCSSVALWDVKALLKEWTTSVEEPGDEDIDHLVMYLNDLIMDRNLEMTDFVLRAMKRLANRMESTSPWRNAYQMIEDRVQNTVAQMYKSRLKIIT